MPRRTGSVAEAPQRQYDSRAHMLQKDNANLRINTHARRRRPLSEVTDMSDTEFEDDEYESDPGLGEPSSRNSINSSGQRSMQTIESYEEIQTPEDGETRNFHAFKVDVSITQRPSVAGPSGPHLFRSSVDSSFSARDADYVLGMSPMTPKVSEVQLIASGAPAVPRIPVQHRDMSTLPDSDTNLDLDQVALWTPRQVAMWMQDAGFESSIVEKFEENDISGAILVTLKFEDLRELDIPSFGKRTKLWNEIHVLRGTAPNTPAVETPVDDAGWSQSRRFPEPHGGSTRVEDYAASRSTTTWRRQLKNGAQAEPVSIIGIEQLMPKPHNCSKGENCSRWRKQQILIEEYLNEHRGGVENGNIESGTFATRPDSNMTTSVVASSDILGPSQLPAFRSLEKSNLQDVQSRDPQAAVKQFIQFQHVEPQRWQAEEPPTPPYEIFPPLDSSSLLGFNGLSKFSIPTPPSRSQSTNNVSTSRRARGSTSLDIRNMTNSPQTRQRVGSPFSDMDVPLTQMPQAPVSRDLSQSVPPNMNLHQPTLDRDTIIRSQSRSSHRRPSIQPMQPPMPPLHEEVPLKAPSTRISRGSISQPSIQRYSEVNRWPHRESVTPASAHFPSDSLSSNIEPPPQSRGSDDTSMSGWMKKRRTRMLRHEWKDRHFTLKGTRLAMHADKQALETLEYIDVDDYAVACSSLASDSKLNAAFKAMNITKGSKKDEAAFAFQLVPAQCDKVSKLKALRLLQDDSKDGKGKTHYFAVKNRDERIDWMRELMLAKALKQKSLGYDVNVNGVAV